MTWNKIHKDTLKLIILHLVRKEKKRVSIILRLYQLYLKAVNEKKGNG